MLHAGSKWNNKTNSWEEMIYYYYDAEGNFVGTIGSDLSYDRMNFIALGDNGLKLLYESFDANTNQWFTSAEVYYRALSKGGNNQEYQSQITETATSTINIYAYGKTIVVENATDDIMVYDAMGRLVGRAGRDVVRNVSTITINKTGIYIVKTGNTVKRVML